MIRGSLAFATKDEDGDGSGSGASGHAVSERGCESRFLGLGGALAGEAHVVHDFHVGCFVPGLVVCGLVTHRVVKAREILLNVSDSFTEFALDLHVSLLEICNCLIDSLNLLFAEGSGFFVQDLLEILELIAEEVANLGGGLTGDLQLADLALHVMHLPSSGLSSQHLFGFLLSVGRVFLNESHDLFELSLDGDISTHRLFSISHHHSEDQFLLILGESEEKVIERDPLGIFTSSRDILVQVL